MKIKELMTHLSELGILAKKPEANIIKLPNISASIPGLKAQSKNYKITVMIFPTTQKMLKQSKIAL